MATTKNSKNKQYDYADDSRKAKTKVKSVNHFEQHRVMRYVQPLNQSLKMPEPQLPAGLTMMRRVLTKNAATAALGSKSGRTPKYRYRYCLHSPNKSKYTPVLVAIR